MRNNATKPSDKEMEKRVGSMAPLWRELRAYISEYYNHEPVLSIGKKDYDWTIRYRKSGKTLVTFSPEKDGFCVLIVLGKDEVDKAKKASLNPFVKRIFTTARQYHDGRWLFIRPRHRKDVESIKTLLTVKKRPKTREVERKTASIL